MNLEPVYLVVAVVLLLNILAGMTRIARGPSPADRMITAQLFGSLGVGILLLLAQAIALDGLRDVALVFALLGGLATVAFVNRVWRRGTPRSGSQP